MRLIAILGLVLCASATARAGVVTFETPSGSMLGGLPVDAEATFITAPDLLTISLTNRLDDPTSVIQCLSDLGFTLSSGQDSGTLFSSLGLEREIDNDGSYTDGGLVDTGWELETAPLRLHVLGTPVGPSHTIIGDAGAGNLYNNANGSIAGNNPHNPFLTGDVTFVLTIPGLREDDTVSSAYFSFGTTEGNNVTGELVPEPGTCALLVLSGLAALRRRSRRS